MRLESTRKILPEEAAWFAAGGGLFLGAAFPASGCAADEPEAAAGAALRGAG